MLKALALSVCIALRVAKGFSGTLEQEQPDGSVRPSLYISRATLNTKRHLTSLDLEAGSIVWCIKRLRGYLWGTRFQIFADHKSPGHFTKAGENSPRVQRWLEFLTAYTYTLEYRKGNADFLSRLPLPAIERARSGSSQLTQVANEEIIFFVRSCGLQSYGHPVPGVGLRGLVPEPPSAVLGGPQLSSPDFADFR